MPPHPSVSRLFSPVTVGTLQLANRLAVTGHSTGLNQGPRITDALIAYYAARARAGLGLIITGSTSVDRSSTSRLMPALSCWDDGVIPDYIRLAEAVHLFGTRVFVQLNHAGALSGSMGGTERIVAPSAVDSEYAADTPAVLREDEIGALVEAFAAGASRVQEGRLDGVELHGGHGNLIQQFLSPLTNRRDDAWGGDAARRRRFAETVIRAVRCPVGTGFVVGMRISAQEDHPGGLTLADMQAATPHLVACGLDYVNVTSGSDLDLWSLAQHYAPMYLPPLHMRALSRGIRSVAGVPVLAVGRIVDPRQAEALLTEGDADLIGMTRASIADAALPTKARRGDFESIRPCVGLNEGCLGRLFRGLSISCVQDPVSGREHTLGPLQPAATARRVVIVGGGVAGLEAARVAALRGHAVVLLERGPAPGGQVMLAARAPGRGEMAKMVEHLLRQLDNLRVDIRSNTPASTDSILKLAPDAVILATGAEPGMPAFGDSCPTISAWAALDVPPLGPRIVVYDSKGDMVGLTTAEFLARRGHSVTVIIASTTAAPKAEPMTARLLRQRLADLDVPLHLNSTIRLDMPGQVRVIDRDTGKPGPGLPADCVVLACGAIAQDRLRDGLRRCAPSLETHVIGDAAAPRDIERAIYEGHMAARAL